MSSEAIVWEVICRCGYYAVAFKSAGWERPIPSPPRRCPECHHDATVYYGNADRPTRRLDRPQRIPRPRGGSL